ncbi:hypothetical protein ANCDUO_12357 [Ancylostoma duodenale]|uniref:Uncharacterized protein n=1 Tax=Ancylostoma duodenale TaxID=51022 RepID=A0A0C2D5S4_9BILA|nr:hypothetical protein ANCDUO_12357 [Ancylostoma duodenale]
MQPKLKLGPRKIGVQGPSIRKRESPKEPQFTRDELAELKRLSAMLPPRAAKEQDPAQLVLNAANYIQQLVATVQARVHKGTLPVGESISSITVTRSSYRTGDCTSTTPAIISLSRGAPARIDCVSRSFPAKLL